VVPEQAVFMQGEDQVMYRVVEGRAQRTKVEVGQRRDGKAEIVQGISAGDTIVLAGWQRLRDGAPVRPAGGGGPPGGGGAAKAGDAKAATPEKAKSEMKSDAKADVKTEAKNDMKGDAKKASPSQ
jgi:hypothetical protein